jgi:hypothetical protein
MRDPYDAFSSQVASPGDAVAPVDVVAPSLKDAPMSTAGADPYAAFSDEYNQTAPNQQGTGDEVLGFITHADHAFQRMNAVNPVRWGLNKMFPGQFPANTDQSAPTRALTAQYAAQGKTPGMLGNIAGDALGTAPTMALPGGPMVQGAVSGMATGSGTTPQAIAMDAGTGAIGGYLGGKLVRTVGSVISPELKPPVRRLYDANVKLAPQAMAANQGFIGNANKLSGGFPVAGELKRAADNASLESYPLAVANDALSHIGSRLPDSTALADVAPETLKAANAAYSKVGAGKDIPLDDTWKAEMAGHKASIATLPADLKTRFNKYVIPLVDSYIDPVTGQIPAKNMAALKVDLNKEIANWSNPDGFQKTYLDAVKGIRKSVFGALGRSAPGADVQLANADATWTKYKLLADATKRAAGAPNVPAGGFTPAHLMSAIKAWMPDLISSRTAPLQGLAQDGLDVLPRAFTAPVSVAHAIPEAMVTAGVGASDLLGGNRALALAAPMLAAFMNVNPALTRAAMASRPSWAPVARGLFSRYAGPPAPILGGALAAQGAQAASAAAGYPYYGAGQ